MWGNDTSSSMARGHSACIDHTRFLYGLENLTLQHCQLASTCLSISPRTKSTMLLKDAFHGKTFSPRAKEAVQDHLRYGKLLSYFHGRIVHCQATGYDASLLLHSVPCNKSLKFSKVSKQRQQYQRQHFIYARSAYQVFDDARFRSDGLEEQKSESRLHVDFPDFILT